MHPAFAPSAADQIDARTSVEAAAEPSRLVLPSVLGHETFARVFQPGKLTLGFILPLEGYPDVPVPTLHDHAELARRADEMGFAALWARDVPLLDPAFGDAGQVLDPFVYLGFLASQTKRIALGTASTVLTLRHPVHVAKQAASVDVLSDGRLLLGVASGDRPVEYPVFGVEADYETRGDRFRDAFATFRAATEQAFPVAHTTRFGTLRGNVDVLPKPVFGRIPMLVTGHSRQELDWIAGHGDGWLYYNLDLARLRSLAAQWRAAVERLSGEGAFKPFAQGFFFELSADPDEPVSQRGPLLRGGRDALLHHLQAMASLGVSHVAFNLKPSRRPAVEVMAELAEFVLPHFALQSPPASLASELAFDFTYPTSPSRFGAA
jgi:luciferase-type oxidoreductase